MNKYRITNPNNNKVRDCKSRTTENSSLYNNSEFNFEFEAKIAKSLIGIESGAIGKIQGTQGMMNFINNEYDFGDKIKSKEVNSSKFLSKYKEQANGYANYNIKNNIGNIHYKKPTNQTPKSLIRLINETRP